MRRQRIMAPYFFFFSFSSLRERESMHMCMCLAGPHEKGEREKVKW
jgi:hypothetical protein